ncbi:hypothetical protein NBN67_19405 [Clostridioides difficile]|uniref:hypothetical protein n=1 Tax=Clostridioides difficile TaxID=1496 RepID=UPI00202EE2EA|nr:hypothetical protein [Clostridioides difficile]MCM0739703.1 hypothetical protein [Clostridioides difficile]MDI3075310.1 hypothetical protein [Clostridioides difficile]MDK3168242.1 hypothetical protein [Clostridioides difficile]HBF2930502.1 hypothetical protein [Clostridioides difficile]HBF2935886.1 hypothetical protein [Clostridioides difficile]
MLKIAVGEKFPTKLHDGLSITFGEAGFTVTFKLDNLSEEEILEFCTGNLRIDISFLEKIMFFIFTNPHGIGNADIPFDIHFTDVKEMQDIKENEGYRMDLILIEGKNNIVKGFRMISFSTKASEYIKKCTEVQLLEKGFNKENYVNKVINLHRRYNLKEIKGMSGAYNIFKK